MLDDLIGVIVSTDEFDAMRHFYIETLGLSPRSDRPGFVNFEFGGRRLTIATHSGVRGHARDPHRILVNFGVTDMLAVHAALVARGVRFSRSPEREEWGGMVATFHDPDGNTLQLLQLGNT